MKKATQKAGPVTLGTKRTCPECGTKFYDFNKDEIVCPKCESKVDPNNLNPSARLVESKRSKAIEKEEVEPVLGGDEIAVSDSDDVLESIDELEDDDDVVEDLEVEGDDEEM